jgi:hypothetical protein
MHKIFLFKVLESKYCLISFTLGLILGYLIVPHRIFTGFYTFLGVIYILMFAIVLMCIVRTIKDRITNEKQTGATTLSVIASLLGIGALQACGIGAPVCGATVGVGILSVFFPQSAFAVLEKYAVHVIILSLILQIVAIFYMGCFRSVMKNLE